MRVVIDRAIPLRLYKSPKGAQYLTVAVEGGEVVFSATTLDLSRVPMLTPVSIEAKVTPIRYGKNQVLRLDEVSVKQL